MFSLVNEILKPLFQSCFSNKYSGLHDLIIQIFLEYFFFNLYIKTLNIDILEPKEYNIIFFRYVNVVYPIFKIKN